MRATLHVLVVVAMAVTGRSATIIVDASGAGDETNLYRASQHAQSGDELLVRPGVYLEPFVVDGKQLRIVSIDPEDPAIVASTIIDLWLPTLVSQNEILFGADCVVEGLTIRNGRFTRYGGAVSIYAASARFRNCVFNNNECTDSLGGAVDAYDSSVEFERCSFVQNRSRFKGSAISVGYSATTIRGCDFTGNLTTWNEGSEEFAQGIRYTIASRAGELTFNGNRLAGEGIDVVDCPWASI